MTLFDLRQIESFAAKQKALGAQMASGGQPSGFRASGLVSGQGAAAAKKPKTRATAPDSPAPEALESLKDILVLCSDRTLFELSMILDPTSTEQKVLSREIERVRGERIRQKLAALEDDDLAALMSKWIAQATVDESFFSVLTQYIKKAGYKKFSDFYEKKLEMNRKKWYLYASGKRKVDKNTVFWMIFFLKLDLIEGTYLLNAAGYVFEKNSRTDMAVLFFLKEGMLASMTPEEALIALDETLEYLGEPPIYTIP